jgi:hypothetical protein
MKLRMLLKGVNADAGLVEITPFANRPKGPEPKLTRRVDKQTGRTEDFEPVTGEVWHEYLRGVTSVSIELIASGDQTTPFDDVLEWAAKRMQGPTYQLMDVSLEEASG